MTCSGHLRASTSSQWPASCLQRAQCLPKPASHSLTWAVVGTTLCGGIPRCDFKDIFENQSTELAVDKMQQE